MNSPSWPTKRLDEVAEVIGRGITPKYCDDGDFVVLNQRCVRDGRINFELARGHDSKQRKVKEAKVLRIGDIVVNSTGVGTLGRTAQVHSLSGLTTADSHLTILRPFPDVDPLWLGYVLSGSEPSIEAMAEGSTGQTELSRYRLAELPLVLPPKKEQKSIASILRAFDRKIESNQRQISILNTRGLARISQTASEPGNLKSLELSNLTTSIARGVAPKYADDDESAPHVLNQKCIRDNEISLGPARRMYGRKVKPEKTAQKGDILVNSTGTGTLGRVARWNGDSIFVDGHISIVRPQPEYEFPTALAYEMFSKEDRIVDLATGSTGQTELSARNLGTLLVTDLRSTSKEEAIKLERELSAGEELIASLKRQNLILRRLRDTLLPELLSGRITPEQLKAGL